MGLNYKNSKLYQQVEVQENFNNFELQSTQSQSSPTIEKSLLEQPSIVIVEGMSFILLIPLLLFILGFILKVSFLKFNKERPKLDQNNPKIACRRCCFYARNQYLKCAVHPDKVLTNKAENCCDYQLRKTR